MWLYVKSLEEKVETLSKQLDEKKKADELTEFERMRREAKDEAAKGRGGERGHPPPETDFIGESCREG